MGLIISLCVRMDAQYLKETVGEALVEALDKVLDRQATDPIEYLGLMLLQYIKNQKGKPEEFRKRVFKSYRLPAKEDRANKRSFSLEKKQELEQQNDKLMKVSSTEDQSEKITGEVDETESNRKQLENGGGEGKEIQGGKEGDSTDQVEALSNPDTVTISSGVAVVEEVGTDNIPPGANETEDIQGNQTTSEDPAVVAVSTDSNINTAEAIDGTQGREEDITHKEPTETQSPDAEGDPSTIPVDSTE